MHGQFARGFVAGEEGYGQVLGQKVHQPKLYAACAFAAVQLCYQQGFLRGNGGLQKGLRRVQPEACRRIRNQGQAAVRMAHAG